jgi:hypothetical protein
LRLLEVRVSELSKAAAREALATALLRDAESHEAGDYRAVGTDYDQLDEGLPRGDDPDRALFVALHFWDGWIDARNHAWLYYKPIGEADWPRLAKAVARDLVEGRQIGEPTVLMMFDPPPRESLRERMKPHARRWRSRRDMR